MPALRGVALAVLVVLATSLQTGLFAHLSIAGVVPDLVLLVVVAVALVHGPTHGAVVGFLAGLALDLAPPADHTAGRWALALLVVGHLVGTVRREARESAVGATVVAAAGAFVGASVFALSGLLLGDAGVTLVRVLQVLPVEVAYTTAAGVLVLPLVMALLHRLEPDRARMVAA